MKSPLPIFDDIQHIDDHDFTQSPHARERVKNRHKGIKITYKPLFYIAFQ